MEMTRWRSRHWASGSYIDLVLTAVFMQILFFTTAIWVGTKGNTFYEQNLEEVLFALRMQLGLGWMMCLIAGIGFSVLPLIYDVQGFDKSLMRTFIALNICGQAIITAGIISNDFDLFESLATIGITLLCTSLVSLWSPAMTIFRQKTTLDSNSLGPFSYALGAFLPILGVVTSLAWVLRDKYSSSLSLSEDLIFELVMPLFAASVIISHFNRRLEWEIIKPNRIGKIFAIYLVLLFLALISDPLHEGGDLSQRVNAILQCLPYLFIFFMLNPRQIVGKIRERMPHNKLILASVFWLPFVGISASMEAFGYVETTPAMMSYHRWILIFGVTFQCLWGFVSYLHDDHKKISIHVRKTQWLIFSSMNIATSITVFAMYTSWESGSAIEKYPRIGIAFFALSYILILIYWVKETFFSLDDWHKVPMFYEKYLAHPEQGSGFVPNED